MRDQLIHLQIGAAIRTRRESLGWTQVTLALRSGVSAPRLSLIENGKVDIRVSTLIQIMETMEMDLASVAIVPPRMSLANVLERRNRNRRRLQSAGFGPSDPIARLDHRDARGEDTAAERAALSSS